MPGPPQGRGSAAVAITLPAGLDPAGEMAASADCSSGEHARLPGDLGFFQPGDLGHAAA